MIKGIVHSASVCFLLAIISVTTQAQIITIPVVVHVVHNIPDENISDAQITSQLQVLTEDFRRLNSNRDNLWPQAADAEIEFCLATQNSNGFTNCGISRTSTTVTEFPENSTAMKFDAQDGHDGWNYEKFLNIWVCDIVGPGYATLPGSGDPNLDGIVVDYRRFGTIGDLESDFDQGRTATHLVGHWLNLRDIHGNGDCTVDDFVSDTPLTDAPNYGCDIGHISCGSVDMVQNYMDESDDTCKNLFTLGQKNRMRALFDPGGFREGILTSTGCDTPVELNLVTLTINFDAYPADISWEFRDSSDVVLHSGTGYDNATYEDETITETFSILDGAHSFVISDSYGDGLCCNEGNGNYSLTTPFQTLYTSNGQFGSGETVSLNLNEQFYRFVGPGENWDDNANWNRDIPSECYSDKIFIESDCYKVGPYTAKDTIEIILRDTVTLEIR